MIAIEQHGNFKNTERFLKAMTKPLFKRRLDSLCKEGVIALQKATPVDTGLTASSWDYQIEYGDGYVNIYWTNSNIQNGIPVAILLQYGHGTNGGGYVRGIDYINPAIRPIFEKLARNAWKEVTSA